VLHYLSLTEVAARLRRRELTAATVTRVLLDRIQTLDGRLHAFVTLTEAEALADARRADDELAHGRWRGPLHGVPVALKDLFDTAGVRTTAGTVVMADRVPEHDATVTARLRAAGAVVLGKLALTEGAFVEHHPTVTPPVNPWSAAHWTGVSSSGSGVAVAAGLCFAALGTDTGGSIRFPSGACGIVGLKPTRGRVSRHGAFPFAASLDHVGPMTRTVADAAAVLGVIAGADPCDPTTLRAPVPDYTAALDGDVRGLRIGVDRRYACDGVAPVIVATLDALLDIFRTLGAEVRPVVLPPADALIDGWIAVCAADTALAHEPFFPARADAYGSPLRALIEHGRALPATELARILLAREEFSGSLAATFEEVDLLVAPTLSRSPPTLTEVARLLGTWSPLRFTAPFNMSGSPSLTLPAGVTGDGLPIGLQLIGRHLSEDLLLRAGDAFQRVTDWHRRHPAL